ncbi:MAG: MerR family DNA-binding transcriptional regulator [Gemmatimonadales bacterium]|nr:MerR family DNA-binding transcriptional regulator [Gemmatimonadales bacterium]
MLSIGQAATQLGIEVDTLRRLETEGAIRAERTQGGHRRFDAAEVAHFARSRVGRRAAHLPPAPSPRRSPARPVEHLATRPVRVPPAPIVSHLEEEPRFIEFDDNPQPPTPAPPTRPQAFAVNHLESIKSYGLASIPFDVPATWRAKVIADLERFVSATQFPKHVSNIEAKNIVVARVLEVLSPFREQQAREREKQEAEERARWRVATLKSHGGTYAIRETADWDWSAQLEARREVAKELEVKIKVDWSERDVEKLVDDVLDDWEDDENENENDDGIDEDERDDWDEEE